MRTIAKELVLFATALFLGVAHNRGNEVPEIERLKAVRLTKDVSVGKTPPTCEEIVRILDAGLFELLRPGSHPFGYGLAWIDTAGNTAARGETILPKPIVFTAVETAAKANHCKVVESFFGLIVVPQDTRVGSLVETVKCGTKNASEMLNVPVRGVDIRNRELREMKSIVDVFNKILDDLTHRISRPDVKIRVAEALSKKLTESPKGQAMVNIRGQWSVYDALYALCVVGECEVVDDENGGLLIQPRSD